MPVPSIHPAILYTASRWKAIVKQLVERHGWEAMADRIRIRCFAYNPSVKSSLTFLRKTPWARQLLEEWFVAELPESGKIGPRGTGVNRSSGTQQSHIRKNDSAG